MSTRRTTKSRRASAAATLETLTTWGKIAAWLWRAWKFLRAIPVIGFLAQNWILIVVLVLMVALVFSKILFDVLGAAIWLPCLMLFAVAGALLIKNLIYRGTTDAYSDSGQLARDFEKLSPLAKVLITKVELWLLILAGAIIAAGLSTGR